MRFLKTALVLTVISLLSLACARNPDDGQGSISNKKSTAAKPVAPAAAQTATPTAALSPQPGTNSGLGQPQTGSSPGGVAASADEGSHLFTEMGCAACHGSNGKGVIKGAPDLTNKSWGASQTDDKLSSTIKDGHPPMPPYGGRLTDVQIKSLVAYVRSFAS